MRDLTALTQLQHKSCENANETTLKLLEIDRIKKRITDTGGTVDDDVLVNTLWTTMDTQTRTHVSGKIDLESARYLELRQAVMTFTNLVASTTRGGAAPMNLGSLGGGVILDAAGPNAENDRGPSHALWALDEAGWPIDEE